MALIEHGAIVTKIRGKVKGAVFTANPSGNSLHNKHIPRRTSTQAQSRHRKNFKFFSQLWKKMDQPTRFAWQTFTDNFHFSNKLGSRHAAKPNIVFATINMYSIEATGASVIVPMPFVTPGPATNPAPLVNLFSHSAQITFPLVPFPFFAMAFCSPPFSLGQASLYRTKIKRIQSIQYIPFNGSILGFGSAFWTTYPWAVNPQYVWVGFRKMEPNCFAWSQIEYLLVQIS